MTILPPAPAQPPRRGPHQLWASLGQTAQVVVVSGVAVVVTASAVVGLASHANAVKKEQARDATSAVMGECLSKFTASHGTYPEDAVYGSSASRQLTTFNEQLEWMTASYEVIDCAQATPGITCEGPGGSPLQGQAAYCIKDGQADSEMRWIAVQAGQNAVAYLDELAGS